MRRWIMGTLVFALIAGNGRTQFPQVPQMPPISGPAVLWQPKYNFYKPIGETDNLTPSVRRPITGSRGEGVVGPYVRPRLGCLIPPSAAEIASSGFDFTSQLLTASQAVSLNVPYAKGSAGANAMIVVRDYIASLPCTASDNKTVLNYGHSIRTIITVEDYQAKLGMSLPAIAADATLNHKSSKLNIQVKGLSNPKFTDLVADLAGKDFTVETYTQYMSAESQMVKLVSDPQTKATPILLGVTDPVTLDDSQLTQAPAISWALSQIVAKRSCEQIANHFGALDSLSRNAVVATYHTIMGRCDSTTPNDAQKENAAKFLAGLRIK